MYFQTQYSHPQRPPSCTYVGLNKSREKSTLLGNGALGLLRRAEILVRQGEHILMLPTRQSVLKNSAELDTVWQWRQQPLPLVKTLTILVPGLPDQTESTTLGPGRGWMGAEQQERGP